jgi:3-phenylpropionate/trans-cinnamate dioxygenase ferredoxin reductase subunit
MHATSTGHPILIVGGGLAAAEAAKTLRAEGYDGPLAILTEEPLLPYERPPLTKAYLRGEAGEDELLAQPASFYAEAGVEVMTGARVEAVDVAGRAVRLADGSRRAFDRLLLATGARAARPGMPGVDAPWVHVLRTAGDADRVREAAGRASSAVVAGGGWIAAEAAASLRQLGLDVTLVMPGREVLDGHLGGELGHELTALHERHGVRVVRSARVRGFAQAGGHRTVELDGGDRLATDLAVVGFGAVPAIELATRAGLDTGDGILVDERLETSAPGIFAAGDVASAWNPRYGERVRSEHWDNARRQGRTAARNLLGGAEAYDRVPFFYSDQFELGMEVLGRPARTEPLVRRERDGGLVAVWLRDGRALAGLHVDAWSAKKPLDRLVSAAAPLDPARFRDASVPLEEALALQV